MHGAPAAAAASPAVAHALGMATSVDAGHVALTFDDGPHPEGTTRMLRVLAELGVPATFFLCGEQVLRYPELAREIAVHGHAIGVHGFRHVLLVVRGPRATLHDMRSARDVIEDATGLRPRLYRPPYGVATPAAIVGAHRLGLRPVLWSRWGRDWERRSTPTSVAALATRDLQGGEVVLLHDADHYAAPGSWRVTAAALPMIVTNVRARGLQLVALR